MFYQAASKCLDRNLWSEAYISILKANLSWSPIRTKFCQSNASLSVVLPQLNLTKLKLEYRYLKFDF